MAILTIAYLCAKQVIGGFVPDSNDDGPCLELLVVSEEIHHVVADDGQVYGDKVVLSPLVYY